MSEQANETGEWRARVIRISRFLQQVEAGEGATLYPSDVRALLDELTRARYELTQEREANQEMWAALFDGENPQDWLAEVQTMRAAKAQLHEIGRATHEVVEQLRRERDEARAWARTWKQFAKIQWLLVFAAGEIQEGGK